MFRSRKFQKLVLASASLTLVSVFLGVGLFYRVLDRRIYQEVETSLQNEILFVEQFIQASRKDGFGGFDFMEQLSKLATHRITLMSANGDVLFDSLQDSRGMENHMQRPEIQQAKARQWGSARRFSRTIKMDFLYVAKKIPAGDGFVFVRVAKAVELINHTVESIIWSLVGVLFCVILGATVLLFLAMRKPLAHIEKIIAAAKQLMNGQYDVRVEDDKRVGGELRVLSETINHLASNLESKIQSLQDSEKKFVDILTHLQDGLAVIDHRDEIIFHNYAWDKQLDLTSKDAASYLSLQSVRNQNIQRMVGRARDSKQLVQEVIKLEALEKEQFYFAQSFLLDLQHEVWTIVSMSNITDIKRAEAMKDDFIANASHQLKTPIAAIQGYAETLLDIKHLSEEKRVEYVRKIVKRCKVASSMIMKLLTLATLQEQYRDDDSEEINIIEFVEYIVECHEVRLQKKNITIEYLIGGQEMCIISLPELLEMSLSAVLENAIQYSARDASILIELNPSDQGVQIVVEDQGIGIEKDELDLVFERFYRTAHAQDYYAKGTGIGLSLAASCVKRLKGEIKVQSVVAKGSRFLIQLPENIRNYFTESESTGS